MKPIAKARMSLRLRATALRTFAKYGYANGTIRKMAREAGVSPALVLHHFDSKEALRKECDKLARWHIRNWCRRAESLPLDTLVRTIQRDQKLLPVLPYVAGTLAGNNTRAAEELVDMLAEELESHIDQENESDKTITARFLALSLLGLLLLNHHTERLLKVNLLEPEPAP